MINYQKILQGTEKVIVAALAFMMGVVLIISTIEVGILIFKELAKPVFEAGIWLDINDLLRIFSFFLNVLIGLELFITVILYLKENVLHGEVILLVGITAVARKIIILDYDKTEPLTIIGLALLIAAMGLGYYLIKQSFRKGKADSGDPPASK